MSRLLKKFIHILHVFPVRYWSWWFRCKIAKMVQRYNNSAPKMTVATYYPPPHTFSWRYPIINSSWLGPHQELLHRCLKLNHANRLLLNIILHWGKIGGEIVLNPGLGCFSSKRQNLKVHFGKTSGHACVHNGTGVFLRMIYIIISPKGSQN